MDYETDSRGGYNDGRDNYDRERSGSPRTRSPDGNTRMRSRSASPSRLDTRPAPSESRGEKDASPDKESGARNTGTNLFVTGIHPRLTEEDVTRLFSKYGEVVKCNIMLDPHTRESRGFGFVNFAASDQAEAAKDALQGEVYEGRTLSIERARRNRPRTPTPGKYFGPPKREDDFRRGPPSYGGRPGGGGRGGYPSRGYEDDRYYRGRYDSGDRYYGSRREHGGGGGGGGDDYPPRIDRYASHREDRYGGREDRRGGGSGYYDRENGGGRPAYDSRGSRDPGGAPAADDRYTAPADSAPRGGDRERGGYYEREDRYSRR